MLTEGRVPLPHRGGSRFNTFHSFQGTEVDASTDSNGATNAACDFCCDLELSYSGLIIPIQEEALALGVMLLLKECLSPLDPLVS